MSNYGHSLKRINIRLIESPEKAAESALRSHPLAPSESLTDYLIGTKHPRVSYPAGAQNSRYHEALYQIYRPVRPV